MEVARLIPPVVPLIVSAEEVVVLVPATVVVPK